MEHIVRHVFEFSFLLGLKATGFGAFSLGAWGSPRSRKNRSRNSFLLYQEIKTDDLNPRILEHHWCCRLFSASIEQQPALATFTAIVAV
jgi:hypothetical protein